MKKNNNIKLSEKTSEIAFKLERVSTLMEIMERALEEEFEIEHKKLVSLSYVINDYLAEITSQFDKLECIITENEEEEE